MTEKVQTTGAEDKAWDLSDLYSAHDDPKFNEDLERCNTLADELSEKYRGRIADLTADEMLGLIHTYEEINELLYHVFPYAQMLWTVDTEDPKFGALIARVQEWNAQLTQKLVFIGLEWADAPDDKATALTNDPKLERYKHWLETERLLKPYLLTEPEEKILAEKSTTGATAWARLFGEMHAAARYEWDGEEVPQEMILKQLYNPDRELRVEAQENFTEGLRKNLRFSTYITNMILADKASDDRLRKYPTWVSSRNLSNEVDDASVEALIEAVTGRYDIVNRYYNIKKQILGYDELFDFDRYAPLPTVDSFYQWDEARELILASFEKFHPRVAEVANLFFENSWIDGPVRPAKRSGAYAMYGPSQKHPYIFLNYLGKERDVETMAHELGHGIHMYLSRQAGVLQQGTPLTTAETASTFGEMLVFKDMFEQEDDPMTRLAMVTNKLESSFATVFRQVAMNRYEHAMHTARREEGELSADRLGEFWMETQRDMFGDSVTMTENYSLWWSYVPHFLRTPGYVYAYAFGELLVMALYARYESGAVENFEEKYIELLGKGGSDWPHELLKPMGIDLQDPAFWHDGLNILDNMVSDAEELAKEAL